MNAIRENAAHRSSIVEICSIKGVRKVRLGGELAPAIHCAALTLLQLIVRTMIICSKCNGRIGASIAQILRTNLCKIASCKIIPGGLGANLAQVLESPVQTCARSQVARLSLEVLGPILHKFWNHQSPLLQWLS